MTANDSDKENESPEEKKATTAKRLEEIKQEEQEDASSYYAQGDKGSAMNTKEELEAPVPPVDKAKEDLNLLRAVAFLGFGLAALAIIFILFFIRNLEERVGGMDSAVKQVEESLEPLKTDVAGSMKTVEAIEENLKTVTNTVNNLQGKFGSYEKSMAIMELKRALAMVQGISMGSDASVQSKSTEVEASINSLLSELGGGVAESDQPAGEIQVEEATEEPDSAEPASESSEEAMEEPAEEESAGEESEEAIEESAGEESEESAEEESAGEESEEAMEESAGEESEEAAEEESAEEESAGEESAEEESHEEAPAESEGNGEESAAAAEELPSIEELLKE